MAQYPAKPDIIKAGPMYAPTSCRGFRFQETNEMKTLHAVVEEALSFQDFASKPKRKSKPKS